MSISFTLSAVRLTEVRPEIYFKATKYYVTKYVLCTEQQNTMLPVLGTGGGEGSYPKSCKNVIKKKMAIKYGFSGFTFLVSSLPISGSATLPISQHRTPQIHL